MEDDEDYFVPSGTARPNLGLEEDRQSIASSSNASQYFGPSICKRAKFTESLLQQSGAVIQPRSEQLDIEMNDFVRAWGLQVSKAESSRPVPTLKFPWEVGFAAKVFTCPQSKLPALLDKPLGMASFPVAFDSESSGVRNPGKEARAAAALARLDGPGVWPVVSHRLSETVWKDSQEASRHVALNRLREILLCGPEFSELGRTLMTDILCLQSDARLQEVVADVFSKKSTSTLGKRSKCLLRFKNFCFTIMKFLKRLLGRKM
jgi:hypothetical protein